MKNTDKCATPNAVNVCSMPMPLKDVLFNILNDAIMAYFELINDYHAKVMDRIYEYPVDSRVPEHIQNMIRKIKDNILLMRKHDYTRTEMRHALVDLADACSVAIRQEEHAEKVHSFKALFNGLADRAEEVVNWVEANPDQQEILHDFEKFLRMP